MNHPLQCRCGTVKGIVEKPAEARRAVCYCKDCQAYARYLGRESSVLDAALGTHVVATLPGHVRFTEGLHAVVCMSLSGKGILRWYARCCRTPLGNTPRDPKTAYVGLLEACLAAGRPTVEQSFGTREVAVNTGSARGKVRNTMAANLGVLAHLLKSLLVARLGGGWKRNPFFDRDGRPIRQPEVLSPEERARWTRSRP